VDDLDAAVAEALGGGGGGGSGAAARGGEVEAATLRSAMMDLVRTSCSAFSHMGSNTACGHYVCHIKKGGRWVFFNDAKVAASESNPLHLGYIYFYERRD